MLKNVGLCLLNCSKLLLLILLLTACASAPKNVELVSSKAEQDQQNISVSSSPQSKHVTNEQVLARFITTYLQQNYALKNHKFNELVEYEGIADRQALTSKKYYDVLGYDTQTLSLSFPPAAETLAEFNMAETYYLSLLEDLASVAAVLDVSIARIKLDEALAQNNTADVKSVGMIETSSSSRKSLWYENIIKKNLMLAAIEVIYNKNGFVDYAAWLSNLKRVVDNKVNQNNNEGQIIKSAYRTEEKLRWLRLKADINSLSQYIFSQQAQLFVETNQRVIEPNLDSNHYRLSQPIVCSNQDAEGLSGMALLEQRFTMARMNLVTQRDITDKLSTYELAQITQALVKEVHANPNLVTRNQQLVMLKRLEKIVLERIFLLNQRRLAFFIEQRLEDADEAKTYLQSLSPAEAEIYQLFYSVRDLVFIDYLFASERQALMNLIVKQGCNLSSEINMSIVDQKLVRQMADAMLTGYHTQYSVNALLNKLSGPLSVLQDMESKNP